MSYTSQKGPDDPLVGTTLEGKYAIEKKLGEGGMGAVYIGEHLMMKRRVAIKTLLPQFTKNENAVQRFQREAQAASAIGHPNIVTIHDLGQTPDGMLYIVMELLDGRDLGQEVRALKASGWSKMDVERALLIMRQAGEGLAAAHEKGVVHRDLKPDNIFLTKARDDADRVKLLDFGISKIRTPSPDQARLTTDGSLLGTPYYMSPEQAQGKSDIDHRADIYAFGVIFYELLAGRVPFQDDNMLRVIAMHALEQPPPPRQWNPEITPDMEAFILRAMAKDPASRFQTMNDVLMTLRAITGGGQDSTSAGFAAVSTGNGMTPAGYGSDPSGASWNGGRTPPPTFGAGGGGSWSGQGTGPMPGTLTATPMAWSEGPPKSQGGAGLKIAVAVVGVLLFLGVVGGLAVAFMWGEDTPDPPRVAQPDPLTTPVAQPSYPTPSYPTPSYPTPTPSYPTPTPSYPTPTPSYPAPSYPTPTIQPLPLPLPAVPSKVSVRITSTPSRAKVYEGESLLGQTPLALSLDQGAVARSYVIKSSGYNDHPLSVVPDQDRVLDASLERSRSAGRGDRGSSRGGGSGGGSGGRGSGGRGSGGGLLKQMPTF
jgi:serine/threonine-protein kinase